MAKKLEKLNYGGRPLGSADRSYCGYPDTEHYEERLEAGHQAPKFEMIERFGSKNAWVVKDTANNIVCLQSYNTIVSMQAGSSSIDFYDYSSSTSRHQSLFRDWCEDHPAG